MLAVTSDLDGVPVGVTAGVKHGSVGGVVGVVGEAGASGISWGVVGGVG